MEGKGDIIEHKSARETARTQLIAVAGRRVAGARAVVGREKVHPTHKI